MNYFKNIVKPVKENRLKSFEQGNMYTKTFYDFEIAEIRVQNKVTFISYATV